ncbi:hypothetical protein, variant 1 [Aphanomyces invadans]|uniref:dolichyl-phosphate-mannose--protein mannosyltransferase n=1 Tax=Aphanomyces invadans TaxID=157072 RepID=A0A024UXS2_9STRA|nr:hypothetical protein, variant 1 [Aphanomyces invadans]ETW10483.1 hypothetical protein, variant 1 [Aphanomyces invadans]|eukprot:XP_008861894.1 hypothetical protein, variant 1 [Aphanomyces invadans]
MTRWSVAAVGAAAMIAYSNTTFSHFAWDDRGAILTNMDVRTDVTPIQSILYHDFWGMNLTSPHSHKSFRPVTVASFRLNYAIHGLHPHGYHLVNVLLHGVVSMLVVRTGQALCVDNSETMAPLFGGLLFAVHPIHCDSVASVVGRSDILCAVFSLLALLSYHQGLLCRHQSKRRQHTWTLFAVASICLATLAKESGFAMFAVLVAMEYTKHCGVGALRRSGGVMAAGAAFFAWRVWMNGPSMMYQWSIYENEFAHLPSTTAKALSYAHVHSLYLWKLFWPRHLCYDYGWKTIDAVTSVNDVRNFGSAVAYVCVLTCVIVSAAHRQTSPVFVMLALGICPFVPASHVLFPVGTIVAERLLYLPSVGFCLVVGWVVDIAMQAANPAAKVHVLSLVGLVLIAATMRTATRNLDWYDEATLFQSALHVAPTSVKVLSNLGKVTLPKNATLAALYLEHAVTLMPTYALAHLNLAACYSALKQPLHAMHHLVHSIELVPNVKAHISLGQHLVEFWESHVGVGDSTLNTAARLIRHAIDQGAACPSAFYGHAKVAFAHGNIDDTLRSLAKTKQANAHVAARGYDLNEAVDPCLVDTLTGLAWERSNLTAAVLFYGRVMRLPTFLDCVSVVNNAAASLHRYGRTVDAVALLEAATVRHPLHAVLWSNAGYMAESLGRHDDSLMFFETALQLQPDSPHVRTKVELIKARRHQLLVKKH